MRKLIEEKFQGIPVLLKEGEPSPGSIRIRVRKREIKHLKFSRLDARQKQALKNLLEKGPPFTPAKKKEAGIEAGYSDKPCVAVRAVDRLLERKEIINKLEKECQGRYQKDVDSKVAEVLVKQLEAEHPLSKEGKKDNLAIIKASQELNKLRDNYPPKRIDVREMGVHISFTTDDIEAAKRYWELESENS